jgi:ribonuclease BN (tRNA processing enzyme)
MSVRAYPVLHCGSIQGKGILDPIPALGYRVTCEGESVAVTGDTGDCPGVRELVTGADLALVEATFQDSGIGEAMLSRVHLSEDRAGEIGALAKKHLLVHRGARG